MTNTDKPNEYQSQFLVQENGDYLLQETGDYLIAASVRVITNISKPI